MDKLALDGPKCQIGPGSFFPTNPDLADILGRTVFDCANLYLLIFHEKTLVYVSGGVLTLGPPGL